MNATSVSTKTSNWKQALLVAVFGLFFCVITYFVMNFMTSLAFYGLPANNQEVEQYVRDSKTMVLTDVTFLEQGKTVYWSIPQKLGSDLTRSKSYVLLQDNLTGKYYSLESYNKTVQPKVQKEAFNSLYLEINKDELSDASKGTVDNPIPVLRWHASVGNDHGEANRDYMSEGQYRNSVSEYLSTREKWWQVWRHIDDNVKAILIGIVFVIGVAYNWRKSDKTA